MLVEIILGKKTGEAALAVALDYVRAIRKTPIVVNDSRGFYTSRVVGTYIREGQLMLTEGVPAAMIENVGRLAGMPVGPLSLTDEVAVDLAWKVLKATEADLGPERSTRGRRRCSRKWSKSAAATAARTARAFTIIRRTGRSGCGLALPTCKRRSSIRTRSTSRNSRPALGIQALESARCVEEGVITDMREADVGSILGFGFAPFTGGTISYIDRMGARSLRRHVQVAGEETRSKVQAVQAPRRHGGQERDVLSSLPARATACSGVRLCRERLARSLLHPSPERGGWLRALARSRVATLRGAAVPPPAACGGTLPRKRGRDGASRPV